MKRVLHSLVALAGIGVLMTACAESSGDPSPTGSPSPTPSDTSSKATGDDSTSGNGNGSDSIPNGNQTDPYGKPDHGVPWNDTVSTYGVLTDARDGSIYRTVRVGTQTWMAENLAFKASGADSGWCPGGFADSCGLYGRLYPWAAAMAGAASSASSPSGIRGICPEGWHLPSQSEWATLVSFAQSDSRVGANAASRAFRTSIHWLGSAQSSTDGWDLYGFRALPGGMRLADGTFSARGTMGSFWTSTELDATKAVSIDLLGPSALVHPGDGSKGGDAFSVRCVGN